MSSPQENNRKLLLAESAQTAVQVSDGMYSGTFGNAWIPKRGATAADILSGRRDAGNHPQ